ncbi:MAG TPA: outer membrane protein assembly factor BamA [Candidatus Brocadiia bacterium]|nr:outer membrane protein assembly factor BamA [Candidatus Brocadiia bacterium]
MTRILPVAGRWPEPIRVAFLAAFVALACSPLSLPAQEQPPEESQKIIREIAVEGNKTVKLPAILNQMKSKVGDPISQDRLDEDLTKLYTLGYFDDVNIYQEDAPGGVKLRIVVAERRKVDELHISGNHEASKSTIREVLLQKEGEYLNPVNVRLDRERIKDLYWENGMPFIRVYVATFEEDGKFILEYRCEEGVEGAVRKFEFHGNEHYDYGDLVDLLETDRRWWPAFIFPGFLNYPEFQEDVERVREFYRNEGYLDSVVAGYPCYSDDKQRITCMFDIFEGPRYFTEEIRFNGNVLFKSDELADAIPLKKGEHYSPKKLKDSERGIGDLYAGQGHLDVGYMPASRGLSSKVSYDMEKHIVYVEFTIEEGEATIIRDVRIEGNDKTQDNVIRRELKFNPGERVNLDKVEESKKRLRKLGYFDQESPDAVDVVFEPSEGTYRDAVVRVKEGRSGMIRFSVGFSTNFGPLGEVTYQDRNFDISDTPKDWDDFWDGTAFRGAGHVLTMSLRPGKERTDAIIQFLNPSVNDTPYRFGFNAYVYERYYQLYAERRYGGSVSFGRRLTEWIGEDWIVTLTPGIENIYIHDADEFVPDDVTDAEGSHMRQYDELKLEYDSRDSFTFPTEGNLFETSYEISTLDVEVMKYRIGDKQYWTVWNPKWWGRHVLSVEESYSIVGNYGPDVPIFERLYAGGQGSLRGFRYRGVSPVDDDWHKLIGGRQMALASVEHEVPIIKDYFRGAIWTDAGSVENNFSDLVNNYRLSVGVGVRLRLPMFGSGMALDFGFPLRKEKYDKRELISFGVTGMTQF